MCGAAGLHGISTAVQHQQWQQLQFQLEQQQLYPPSVMVIVRPSRLMVGSMLSPRRNMSTHWLYEVICEWGRQAGQRMSCTQRHPRQLPQQQH